MIAGARGGWQTIIADLSLILFMVTSAAMVNAPDPAEVPDTAEMVQGALPAQGAPLGVYRAGEGGPPLSHWLAMQAPDDRPRLTVIARYPTGDGGMEQASAAAMKLAGEASQAGVAARIVLEPLNPASNGAVEVTAVLAFDGAVADANK